MFLFYSLPILFALSPNFGDSWLRNNQHLLPHSWVEFPSWTSFIIHSTALTDSCLVRAMFPVSQPDATAPYGPQAHCFSCRLICIILLRQLFVLDVLEVKPKFFFSVVEEGWNLDLDLKAGTQSMQNSCRSVTGKKKRCLWVKNVLC